MGDFLLPLDEAERRTGYSTAGLYRAPGETARQCCSRAGRTQGPARPGPQFAQFRRTVDMPMWPGITSPSASGRLRRPCARAGAVGMHATRHHV